ncbi:MAG: hypothetical protein JW709_13700 [Sedimentisphaerales bacterium]|nr:hypothetical protein [Sedimentisphaerales bacterium]
MFAKPQEQTGYKQTPVCCFGPGGEYVRFWPAPGVMAEAAENSGVFFTISRKLDNLLRKIGLILKLADEQESRKAALPATVASSIQVDGQKKNHHNRLGNSLFSDIRPVATERRATQKWLFDDIEQNCLIVRSDNHIQRIRHRHPVKSRRQTEPLRQELLF